MASKRPRPRGGNAESQVVGFRIPQALARDVKAEAAWRGLKLNQLLVEM